MNKNNLTKSEVLKYGYIVASVFIRDSYIKKQWKIIDIPEKRSFRKRFNIFSTE